MSDKTLFFTSLSEIINLTSEPNANELLADIFDQSVDKAADSDLSAVFRALESIKLILDFIHLNRHHIDNYFSESHLKNNFEKLIGFMNSKKLIENQFIAKKCVQILLSLLTIIISFPSKELSNAITGTYTLALEVISDPTLGEDMVVFLALATQTVHSEDANNFVLQLSIMNQEEVLSAYVLNIANKLDGFNRIYREKMASSSRILSFLTDKWRKTKTEESTIQILTKSFSVLFALFQVIRLNRDFIAALTYSHIFLPPKVTNKTSKLAANPKNLLTIFLEFMSVVALDVSDPQRRRVCLLCFLVLNTICGDEYANYLIHVHAMTFSTVIYNRAHVGRKNPPLLQLPILFINFLDEFLKSNLVSEFPYDLYILGLRSLHCLLCYEKKAEYRLDFKWESIWNSLFSLLNYVVKSTIGEGDGLMIIYLILVIFNMFILYGDCFLKTVDIYDQLYYELLHKKDIFLAIDIFLKDCANKGDYCSVGSLSKTQNCLDNILSMVNHIGEKVDHWASTADNPILTQEIVYSIIKDNLEVIYFQILPFIDHFVDDPTEAIVPPEFFRDLVDIVVHEVRTERLKFFEVLPEYFIKETHEEANEVV